MKKLFITLVALLTAASAFAGHYVIFNPSETPPSYTDGNSTRITKDNIVIGLYGPSGATEEHYYLNGSSYGNNLQLWTNSADERLMSVEFVGEMPYYFSGLYLNGKERGKLEIVGNSEIWQDGYTDDDGTFHPYTEEDYRNGIVESGPHYNNGLIAVYFTVPPINCYFTEIRVYIYDPNDEPPVEPYETPVPVVTSELTTEALVLTATGEGSVTLYIQHVDNETGDLTLTTYTGEGSVTVPVPRVEEDTYINYWASAQANEESLPGISGVTYYVLVPALEVTPPEPQVTPQPEITFEVTDDAVIITATGEGEVLLYVDGEPVENPCTIERGATDVVVVVTATAQAEDMLISDEAMMEITIPAISQEPEDPYATGTWVVFIDKDGNEQYYELVPGDDPDGVQQAVALTWKLYGHPVSTNPEDWHYIPFYFLVNGVTYGPDADGTEPVMGNANMNPLYENENMWQIQAGYKYVVGIVTDIETGNKYVQISQGTFVDVDELNADKTVAGVRYFNMIGQEMQEANGMTIVVTTYTDGTTNAVKVMK